MFILKVENAAKEWNGQPVFESVNLEIQEGEHLALIGANGTGKTTLLKILLGLVNADAGKIVRLLPPEQWGWMEQQPEAEPTLTSLEYVQAGTPDFYRLKKELEQSMEMDLYQAYLDRGGYEWEARVEQCLTKLQLPNEAWDVPFVELSGGQKTRVQLARLLIREPKFLLLDEPTNHLDEATMDWLEEWIRNYKGTVLTVSHDRHFLDRTADAIYELTANGAKRYKGGYTDFREQRELENKTQMALHKKQERERQALLEAIQRYRQWFEKAHNAAGERNPVAKKKANKHITRLKSKAKAVERLDREKAGPVRQAPHINAAFNDGEFPARTFVRMENISFSYQANPIFADMDLIVSKGDRIAVIGPNGAGKSTLLKLIVGELQPNQGSVRHNPQLQVGYFAQELEKLALEETVLGSVLGLPDMTQSQARTILACFLFRGDAVFRKIADLSMGEKCRVAFVRLYFSGANLLVLDEPTNYLDIETRERLEEALAVYPGAMVIVSHDRYLLRKLANRVVHLDGKQIHMYDGTYEEYFESRRQRAVEPNSERSNQIRQLELQLQLYMSQEEPGDPAEQAALIALIREVKSKLEQLKKG